MDEADRGSIEEDRFRQEALARRRQTLLPTGYCHYCGEGVRPGLIFCDIDCGSDYERDRDIRTRQGKG